MFLVCRNKDDNSLFITTRASRESMLSVYRSLGEIPESNVLKQFKTYDDALKYKQEQERINKDLNNILKNKP